MDSPWIISEPLAAVEAITTGGGDTDCQSNSVMPLRVFVSSLERLAGNAADAAALWRAGEVMDLAHLGAIGCAMTAAPTLGAALRCFVNYFGTVQSASSLSMEQDGDMVALRYRVLDEDIWPRAADAQLTLGVICGTARRFAPDADRALIAQLEVAESAPARAITAHLERQVRGGMDNALFIPARLLDRTVRLVSDNPSAAHFRDAVQTLDQHQRNVRLKQPVSDRVIDLLLRRMGQDGADLGGDQDAIARAMGMSRRTLRRKLEAEGTSFHELNESCRRNVGRALLARSDLPMIEIALRLGYSDHTAFSRAFTRWFGVSPRELRKTEGSARSNAT
ncbi:AraC-like transcriptional regulator QhpR [Paracoccus tegillarcae]|uniref:AraC family transcriptional regulator n=1 Tax=Paracoccus tegillarcae TaxID=1529068 RepID=A0A2K9EY14_9RHOB|nr:AraC family transcriptional regulator [Paracoccus tegillarcae]AUH34204.1 AraC family transcriptional regulator [Paracoccus tegillarcae]